MAGHSETVTLPESQRDASDVGGTRFGRYTVRARLGRGGMGEVFLAHDPELDRLVAVKVIRAELVERSPEARARFHREAQAMARLNHPNVVSVYDVGVTDDTVYVAMERIDGPTLAQWLADQPRSLAAVLEVFADAGRGLAAAHDAGLVHRDFKPSNVMLGDRVRVVDFGLARSDPSAEALASTLDGDRPASPTALDARITAAGRVLGTPAYMAPEQRLEQRSGPAVDQYSFAVALREAAIAGSARVAGDARPVPRWLRRILDRALAFEPEARYPSMHDLLRALARGRARRRRLALGLGAAAVVGLGVVAIVRQPEAEPSCDTAGAQIAPIWSDAAQHRVATALRKTGRPYADDTLRRVSAALDTRLAAWADAHRKVCEATHVYHEQSEALLDVRMRCLGRARAEIEALVAQLGEADAAAVDRATTAAAQIGDLTACTQTMSLTAYPRPATLAQAATVEALRQELARVDALFELGQAKRGLPEARALLPRARALGYPPVLASALFSAARLEYRFGDKATASDELYEVTRIGAEIDDAHLVARANTLLVSLIGWDQQRFEAAEVAYRLAQGQIVRAGNPPRLLAQLHAFRASVLYQKGEYAAALAEYERALPLYQEVAGPDSYDAAKVLGDIADAELKLGRLTEVVAKHERAIAIAERAVGTEHLFVAAMLSNFGMTLLWLLDFDRAAQVLQHSLDIKEKVLAPDDPSIAISLHNFAIARKGQRRMTEAKALLGRAIQIRETKLGLDHPLLATSYGVLASVHVGEGELEPARALFEKTLAIKHKAYGPDHASVAITQREYADVLVSIGRVREARAAIERAIAIDRDPAKGDPGELQQAMNVLGNVLMAEKRFNDARDAFRQALEAGEKMYGADSPSLTDSLVGLSAAAVAGGDAVGARSYAERAIVVARQAAVDYRVSSRFALAWAQWLAGDRAAAVASAREARAAAAALPPRSPLLAEIDRWLATHAL